MDFVINPTAESGEAFRGKIYAITVSDRPRYAEPCAIDAPDRRNPRARDRAKVAAVSASERHAASK